MGQAELKVGRKPRRKRAKQPPEALTNAVNHWIRVEILAILHEGQFTTGEVATMIGEDVKQVHPHMKILYDSGCIEYVGDKDKGNIKMPVFRAIVTPVIDVEGYRAMSLEDRHDLNGAIGQGFFTEFVSSYRSGKLDADEESHVVWDLINVDAQGKREIHDLLVATYEKAKSIHAQSVNRMAVSKEEGTTTVISLWCFERGRTGRPREGYRKGLKK